MGHPQWRDHPQGSGARSAHPDQRRRGAASGGGERRSGLMSNAMVSCERVDLDFIETAPYRFRNSVELAITPEQLFEVLADPQSWPHWATVITKVTWTSPEPLGVGATRTVHMRGGIVGDEEFLAWEPFSRMAFRFNECST